MRRRGAANGLKRHACAGFATTRVPGGSSAQMRRGPNGDAAVLLVVKYACDTCVLCMRVIHGCGTSLHSPDAPSPTAAAWPNAQMHPWECGHSQLRWPQGGKNFTTALPMGVVHACGAQQRTLAGQEFIGVVSNPGVQCARSHQATTAKPASCIMQGCNDAMV